MSTSVKYRLSSAVVAITVPVMCYALSQIIPAGLSGNTAKVKGWYALFGVVAVVGIGSFIGMRYWKVRLENPEAGTSEAEILSNAAIELARKNQSAPTESSPQSDKPNDSAL
jgi:predicted MFS family arabinose efflux permease